MDSDFSTIWIRAEIAVIEYNNEGSENNQEQHVRHFLFVFTLSKPVEGC